MFSYLTVLLAFQFSLFGLSKASCHCPSCPAASSCSIQCPPPVACPPKICPALPVCSIVLPRSCPVCIKPIVKSVPITVVKPIYKVIDKPVIVNRCCKTCGEHCILRVKRNILNDSIVTINSACNNKMLGAIIAKTMTSNPTISQELIMEKVTKSFGQYNIFCSTGNLTYVAYTDDFCQIAKGGVVCYIFKNL
uniref:Ground-like domain-containing protein n=1 Tax=Elaeophora elaphi TaxID=1147741 RepID=A0A0R3RYW3_9BILA